MIKDHRFESLDYSDVAVQQLESPNHYDRDLKQPVILVMHYTAGRSFQSTVNGFMKKATQRASHLVVGKDGEVAQLVDFDKPAWHAGRSSWDGRNSCNNFSIGIEIDNYGWLKKTAAGNHKSWFGVTVNPDDVVMLRHENESISNVRPWEAFKTVQLESVFAVTKELCEFYNIVDIVGHDNIKRGKTDPGPAFPMDKLRLHAIADDSGKDEDESEYDFNNVYSSMCYLNLRSRPSIDNNVMCVLSPGTLLGKHDAITKSSRNEKYVWYKVTVLTGLYTSKIGWCAYRRKDKSMYYLTQC